MYFPLDALQQLVRTSQSGELAMTNPATFYLMVSSSARRLHTW